jgi:hypothetical protein
MAAEISIATANFVGLDGLPRRPSLIIASEGPPLDVGDGYYITAPEPILVQADSVGHLAVNLVRGSKVRVAIEGTTYVRSIVVPDLPTFDLIKALGDVADHFAVQTLPALTDRRSF